MPGKKADAELNGSASISDNKIMHIANHSFGQAAEVKLKDNKHDNHPIENHSQKDKGTVIYGKSSKYLLTVDTEYSPGEVNPHPNSANKPSRPQTTANRVDHNKLNASFTSERPIGGKSVTPRGRQQEEGLRGKFGTTRPLTPTKKAVYTSKRNLNVDTRFEPLIEGLKNATMENIDLTGAGTHK